MSRGKQTREKEALRWVERLLETGITDSLLIQAGQCISQCHYSDVVEERNIERLCGYPGCDKQLGPVPRQKYHISLERKQVFDLTERKKFCSNGCYKSSKFYLSQLSTVPVWAREKETIPIRLLPASLHQRTDTDQHSDTDQPIHTDQHTDTDQHSDTDQPIHTDQPTDTDQPAHIDKNLQSSATEPILAAKQPITITEHPPPASAMLDVQYSIASLELMGDDTEEQLSVQPPKLSTVGKLLHTFNSWYTTETLELLHSGGPLEVGGEGQGPPAAEDPVFLPPVSSLSQSQLQRNILMQQMRRNLSVVTRQLGVGAHQVLPKLAALIKTFRLDRYTITFRPTEWRVILLVLLQSTHPELGFISSHKTQVDTWLADITCSHEELELMMQIFNPPEEQRTNS